MTKLQKAKRPFSVIFQCVGDHDDEARPFPPTTLKKQNGRLPDGRFQSFFRMLAVMAMRSHKN
ncbi:MAG: hypothetical protein GY803_28975 [Chloroflexi bacterium]|nr:hypothetical protein [Chloroflexota bacterium]